MSTNSAPVPTTTKLTLTLKKKKKSAAAAPKDAAAVQQAFGNGSQDTDKVIYRNRETDEPLVIPVGENKLKFRSRTTAAAAAATTTNDGNDNCDDAAALKALQDEAASKNGLTVAAAAANGNNLVIQGNTNTFQNDSSSKQKSVSSDKQQYKDDLEALPDELATDSISFQRVPIAEFGAALLRGMGWTGEDNGAGKKEKGEAMPRPHRLGLGATPAVLDTSNMPSVSSGGRARRPDQVQRQEALQKQQDEYARQREEQLARDKQRTLQNGSLVKVVVAAAAAANGKKQQRAKILQLVGVPGLNMVKVQAEGESEAFVVKRGEIQGLLTRDELDETPFQGVELHVAREKKRSSGNNSSSRRSEDERQSNDKDSKRDSREESHRESSRKDRKRDRDGDRDRSSRDEERQASSKRRREDSSSSRPTWVIPHIRVRVISEKLGRRHYKEKGVVVDVTPKGATLEMANGSVIDRVPERYLETALPKTGGKAVVLSGEHRFAKGRLLERDSRRSRGVIQVFEDMNVLTLSLDDMAEWCGPLDDDLDG